MKTVIKFLRRAALLQEQASVTDGQLLARFLAHRDEAAFEALVRRHGPMVLGLCQRVLGNSHDAEDAYQATFLLLVRKSAALRSPDLVANWLYGVAYRTALKARTMTAKRRSKEKQLANRPDLGRPEEKDWLERMALSAVAAFTNTQAYLYLRSRAPAGAVRCPSAHAARLPGQGIWRERCGRSCFFRNSQLPFPGREVFPT